MAGLSTDCNGRTGNLLAFSNFLKDGGQGRSVESHTRRKHHRWRLDAAQIATYGLSAQLDPKRTWWEYLEVEERVVNVDVFLNSATVTAAFAEDLVRPGPGEVLLRSLGANLIVGLNFDQNQYKNRWPGVAAFSLAADPGSSVLIVTSKAPIQWAAEEAGVPLPERKDIIAVWRDYPANYDNDRVKTTEIELVAGSQAVVVTLAGEACHDTTIDGRFNSDATAWLLSEISQVSLPTDVVDRWSHMLQIAGHNI